MHTETKVRIYRSQAEAAVGAIEAILGRRGTRRKSPRADLAGGSSPRSFRPCIHRLVGVWCSALCSLVWPPRRGGGCTRAEGGLAAAGRARGVPQRNASPVGGVFRALSLGDPRRVSPGAGGAGSSREHSRLAGCHRCAGVAPSVGCRAGSDEHPGAGGASGQYPSHDPGTPATAAGPGKPFGDPRAGRLSRCP